MTRVESELLNVDPTSGGTYAVRDAELRPDALGSALVGERTGEPVHVAENESASRSYFLAKRAFDITGALLALTIGAPVFLLLAAMIKLDSSGPVLFYHERIGHRGRRFRCLKFRTMVKNAEQALPAHLEADPELRRQWEQQHKLDPDPRLTRMGRFLRRFSLDEVPQFWNVLRGEMSLVGPRPIVDEELPRYGRDINSYLSVRPGLSGLWQVCGRNDTSYQQRVRLDRYYVSNQCLLLDLYILARTPRAVLLSAGAY